MIFSIAIDGPAGAGKSTVAKTVAKRLDAIYLDTGAMYRTVGLYMNRKGFMSAEEIAAACGEPKIDVRFADGAQRMFLGDEDVTDLIRSPEISKAASRVSAVPEVRERMVELQRNIAKGHSVVMDGRDIGTKVLPNATLKIFLTASCEVRAKRRCDEMIQKGEAANYDEVLADIVARDYADSHRAASPMVQAEDAVLVDTSDMDADQAADAIVKLAKSAAGGWA